MTAQSESGTPIFDVVKLAFASLLVLGGIVAFYWFSEQALLYRVLALLGVAVVALAAVFTTERGRMLWDFLRGARVEVRKVIWPSRQETTQTTLIVFAMVFIVGLLLWLLDMFLFWAVRMLTGQVG